MELRLLGPDDAGQWWRLRLESLQNDPEAFSASAEDRNSLKADDVRQRLEAARDDFFIMGAFVAGQLVGMAGFYREPGVKSRHKGRIWGVYVNSAFRGRGVGRKLLDAVLIRGAAIAGVEQILISVATTQTAAASLYRSLGFHSFGIEPRAMKIGDRYVEEEHLILQLPG